MQFQKDDIKVRILSAAREEFLKEGFEKASIRKITVSAKTSKSNLYNYVQNKDALLTAVVEPTLSEINNGFSKLKAGNPKTAEKAYTITAQKNVMRGIMDFVFMHEADLKLLLFCSSGSSQSDFKNKVIKDMADVLSNWVSYAASDQVISDFFIQTVAGFYIGAIEQILAEGIQKKQAAENSEVFLKFIYGGWNAILNQKA